MTCLCRENTEDGKCSQAGKATCVRKCQEEIEETLGEERTWEVVNLGILQPGIDDEVEGFGFL